MPERIKIIRQGRASNRYGTGREGGHTGGGFLSPLDVRSSSHEGDASTAGTLATGKGRPPGGCGGQPPTLSSMLQQQEMRTLWLRVISGMPQHPILPIFAKLPISSPEQQLWYMAAKICRCKTRPNWGHHQKASTLHHHALGMKQMISGHRRNSKCLSTLCCRSLKVQAFHLDFLFSHCSERGDC